MELDPYLDPTTLEWVDPTDGRRVPLVSGGSDLPPADPAGGAPAPDPAPPPGGPAGGDPAPPPPPADPGGAPEHGFDDLSGFYDHLLAGEGEEIAMRRDALERLQGEHRDYRERWGGIAKAFETLHPGDAQFVEDFLAGIGSQDPEQRARAAQIMRGALDEVFPADGSQPAPPGREPGGQEPAVPAEVLQDPDKLAAFLDERMEARLRADADRRAQEQATADAVKTMQGWAKDLGDELGIEQFGDPESTEYRLLLLTAQQPELASIADAKERLTKAANVVADNFTKRAQALLAAKQGSDDPLPAPPDGGAPGGKKEPKTWDEADASAAARLDKALGSGPGT